MKSIPLEKAADLTVTDEKTLRRVYRKFDPSYLQDAVDALDSIVSMPSVTETSTLKIAK